MDRDFEWEGKAGRIIEQQVQAEETAERERAGLVAGARAFARQTYEDPIIGGNWERTQRLVAQSYGEALAAEVVAKLKEEQA